MNENLVMEKKVIFPSWVPGFLFKHDNIEKKLEKHWSYVELDLPTIVNLLLVSETQTKHSTIERENIEF